MYQSYRVEANYKRKKLIKHRKILKSLIKQSTLLILLITINVLIWGVRPIYLFGAILIIIFGLVIFDLKELKYI